MDNQILIYGITIIATIILSIFLYKKYHLTRYQCLIFILLVLFWSAVNIVRSYRKAYAMAPVDIGGLALGGTLAANIAAAYGLISTFIRLPVFALSDYFKSRKALILFAVSAVLVTSVYVVFKPGYYSLLLSSLALGISASMLSLFNVLFAETFDSNQAMMSVSILSVAPLLAEFIMSPIQYTATKGNIKHYGEMWIVSAALSLITLIFLLFVKDNKEPTRNFSLKRFKKVVSDQRLLILSAVGILVSFIKFSSSGSNLVAFVRLKEIGMSDFLIAYIDFIYSSFQLVAGVLAGLYFKKKIGIRNTLILGLALCGIFSLTLTITTNQWVIFFTHALSGFGYGLTYNILIGVVMEPYAKNVREMTMGVYQTFFGLGIFFGDKIYAWMIDLLPDGISDYMMHIDVFTIITVITFATILLVLYLFRQSNRKFFENKSY